MLEIIDLSQDIFTDMPVFPGLPEVAITLHASHEQWDGIIDSDIVSPAVNRLELGEHTGTHSIIDMDRVSSIFHYRTLSGAKLNVLGIGCS
jgi:kynurenine formamidase